MGKILHTNMVQLCAVCFSYYRQFVGVLVGVIATGGGGRRTSFRVGIVGGDGGGSSSTLPE